MSTNSKAVTANHSPFLPVFNFFKELIEGTINRSITWVKESDARFFTGIKNQRITLYAIPDEKGVVSEFCLKRYIDDATDETIFRAKSGQIYYYELDSLYRTIVFKIEEVPETLAWYYKEKPEYYLRDRGVTTVLDIFNVLGRMDRQKVVFNVADNLTYLNEKEWLTDDAEDDADMYCSQESDYWERCEAIADKIIKTILAADPENPERIKPQEIVLDGDDTVLPMYRHAVIPEGIDDSNIAYMDTKIHEILNPLFWQDVSVIPLKMQNASRLQALIDTATAIVTSLVEENEAFFTLNHFPKDAD